MRIKAKLAILSILDNYTQNSNSALTNADTNSQVMNMGRRCLCWLSHFKVHIIIAPNPLPPGDDIQSGDSAEYYDTQSDFDQLMSQLLSSSATRDWNGLKYLQQTSAVM